MALVHVMIGSKSDAALVKKHLTKTLRKIGVPYTFTIGSAHRDPDFVREDILKAVSLGTEVFIPVAGMTNGLAGMVAAHAPRIPVIGMPLDRLEGLSSTVDMPPGRGVNTVGVGPTGLVKAAEEACKKLCAAHPDVAEKFDAYLERLRREKPPIGFTNINLHVPLDMLDLLAEGKTKKVYDLEDGTVLIASKDDITAGDGARHDIMKDKARYATTTTCNVFDCLESAGVPTHYLQRHNDTCFVARRVNMIAVEVVMRGTAFGSYLKRNPDALEGADFDETIVEFFLKDDANHDPLMLVENGKVELHAADHPVGESYMGEADGLAADFLVTYQEEFEKIGTLVFEALKTAWARLGHKLIDLKIEFGFDSEKGELLVADVVDNDSWRVWLNGDPKQQVDKQVYRDFGLDEPEVAMRIKGNYALVAKLTEQFALTQVG